MSRLVRYTLPALVFFALAPAAGATTLGFGCITANDITGNDCGIAESQLTVNISAYGIDQVLFEFHNSGPDAASITDVYFDDGTLLGIASIQNGTGVDFSQGASPGNLPSGNSATPDFEATAGFTADSNPPTQPNGVNPGEQLGIVFNLVGGTDFQDVLDALILGGAPGGLRIGIHVQGFADGESESLVNNPVPEPGTLLLLTAGGIGLMARRRRRSHAI